MSKYDSWMIYEIQTELHERNLPTTGIKKDLARRLSEDDARREEHARQLADPKSVKSKENHIKQRELATELRKLHHEEKDPGGTARAKAISSEYKQRKEQALAERKKENSKLEKNLAEKRAENNRLVLEIKRLEKKMRDNDAKLDQDQEKFEDSYKSQKVMLDNEVKREKAAEQKRESLCQEYNALNPPNVRPAKLEDFAPGKETLPHRRQAPTTQNKPKLSSEAAPKASSETRFSPKTPEQQKYQLKAATRHSSPTTGQKHLLFDRRSPSKPPRSAPDKSLGSASSTHPRKISSSSRSPPTKRHQSASFTTPVAMSVVASLAERPVSWRPSYMPTQPDPLTAKELDRRKSSN